jgi:glucokinase
MMIVSDIGGTYVRFAQVIDGQPEHIVKYAASEFQDFKAALEHYCAEQGVEAGEVLIAAAGARDGDQWKVTNNPDWRIDLTAINTTIALNDFEAGTYALPVLESSDLNTLKTGVKNDNGLCLLGPGTGLGLGYFHPPVTVQKTHGGHMPITAVTDEQWDVVKVFRDKKATPVVFEDIVSGQNDFAKTNPKLFHEFLGLFAAQSVIHGHAYGGLYLTGGIIEGLLSEGAFDFDTFEKVFCLDAVSCVKEDLQNTPIHIITDPYPALKGLIHAKSLSDN